MDMRLKFRIYLMVFTPDMSNNMEHSTFFVLDDNFNGVKVSERVTDRCVLLPRCVL